MPPRTPLAAVSLGWQIPGLLYVLQLALCLLMPL